MSIPFLHTLSKSARRAYPIIQAGVKSGLSSRAINKVIKDNFGRGIKRQDLLDTIRSIKDVDIKSENLRFIPRNKRPNPFRLPTSLTRIQRNFAFKMQVTGYIQGTDERITDYVTINSDDTMTINELNQLVNNLYDGSNERYKLILESSLLISAVKSGSLGTLINPVF